MEKIQSAKGPTNQGAQHRWGMTIQGKQQRKRLATMETLYLRERNPGSSAGKPHSTNLRPPRCIQDHDEDPATILLS